MIRGLLVPLLALMGAGLPAPAAAQSPLPRLKVSDDRRSLVTADGRPFFYLGDTAWELFHRLNREQAETYLQDRAAKGFTVIQAVALAELDGLRAPNPYGHTPLIDDDPTRPREEYFAHVDFIVAAAARHGLYVGLLPTWGDKWNKKWGVGPEVFTPENAAAYGAWLGRRYREQPILWILGGDRPIESDRHREIIRAMARGLRTGDGGAHLMTFHPVGGRGSSEWFHDDDWLDFNMRQNGHQPEFTGRYEQTLADYRRQPTKPVLDGEPIYEDHPLSFKARELGHSVAADCRRTLYWNLLSGACGHTYGHHSVWQMYDEGRPPINGPLLTWQDALQQPGAGQMQYGRWLLESRPWMSLVPDDDVIVPDPVATAVPGAGTRRYVAARDARGRCALVYFPVGRPCTIRLDLLGGSTVRAWWYDPRSGAATELGTFPNAGAHRFTPPQPGELLDWILVLDDAAQHYPPPGTRPR
jgi:hypothetical protein